MPHFKLILACATGLLLVTASALPADNVVFDDDFASGFTYSVAYFNNTDPPPPDDNPFDQSFASFSILPTGGNSDDHMALSHFHDVERDDNGDPINGDTLVQSFMRNQSVFYNPADDGAINAVTMSFDYRTSDPLFNSVFVALGENLGGGSFRGFDSVVADGNWQNYSITLMQSDVPSFDFAGDVELEFGFGFTSNEIIIDDPVDLGMQIDNFQVSVSAVPEPGSFGLLGMAGIALCCRRRKRA